MARPPRPSLNPGYLPPREYLQGGFFLAGGQEIRPELLSEQAAAMGRELLIRSVPLELAAQALKELETLPRLTRDWAELQGRLREFASRPAYQPHRALAQLLSAGVQQVRRGEDLAAFTAHLRRVVVLANFERVLASADALELARAERRAKVKTARKRKLGAPKSPKR